MTVKKEDCLDIATADSDLFKLVGRVGGGGGELNQILR